MRIAAEKLKKAVRDFLQTLGAQEQEALLVADVLIEADMRGIATHGCAFVPLIAERHAHGLLSIPTQINYITDNEAITHLDGNNGFGQVAAAEAMRICMKKARQYGVALALIRNTNHIGFLAYYPLMAAAEGMVGICMTNAAPAMAPWGGAEAFLGTNPLAIAAPIANDTPIVLDMSSSVVARGKIRRAQRLQEPIPDGWAIDANGVPTTDPAQALKGTILPIAGPKGYGLALFIDLLCGLLSGSKYGRDVLTFHEPLGPTGVGAMFMAIDIARFMPREQFEALAHEYAEAIRSSKKATGVKRIFLPGEIEAGKANASRSQGVVDVDAQIIEKINRLLQEKGLSIQLEEEK
jgi:LDH2 family malate/lactate/ureidoglycolate dehydrogenase